MYMYLYYSQDGRGGGKQGAVIFKTQVRQYVRERFFVWFGLVWFGGCNGDRCDEVALPRFWYVFFLTRELEIFRGGRK
jgi:hypothetical protein